MATQEKGSLEHIPVDVIEEAKITPDKKEPPSTTKRQWQGLVGFLDGVPGVDRAFKIFKAIYKFGGIQGIICFLLGVALVLLVLIIGWMPNFLIVEKYRALPIITGSI